MSHRVDMSEIRRMVKDVRRYGRERDAEPRRYALSFLVRAISQRFPDFLGARSTDRALAFELIANAYSVDIRELSGNIEVFLEASRDAAPTSAATRFMSRGPFDMKRVRCLIKRAREQGDSVCGLADALAGERIFAIVRQGPERGDIVRKIALAFNRRESTLSAEIEAHLAPR
jgi:hypothetical protein